MKILILCTGNSCRSQMAHGFLQSFDKDIQVYSYYAAFRRVGHHLGELVYFLFHLIGDLVVKLEFFQLFQPFLSFVGRVLIGPQL